MNHTFARSLGALLLAATVVTLSACATPRGAAPTAAPPVAESPSPTPAEETALVVGPGDEPPRLFGGDCENMLSVDEVSGLIDRTLQADDLGGPGEIATTENAGGLQCSWSNADEGVHVSVTAFPAESFDDLDLTAVGGDWTSDDCEWYCAVVRESGDVVVATTINGTDLLAGGDSPSAKIALLGDEVTSLVAANAEEGAGDPWQRDRQGWRSVSRCDALGAAVAAELSIPVTGETFSFYVDSPLAGSLAGDAASRMWVCALNNDTGARVVAWGYAGGGWASRATTPGPEDAPVTGLPEGWDAVLLPSTIAPDSTEGPGMALTDGVNFVNLLAVPADFGASPEQLAAALATAFPGAAD
jgi:hypothetical protein